jgi:DNA mismatch repair ATPase MutS
MKEQEIIEKQNANDNKLLYLIKLGMFFHAYEAAAYALANVTHYRVIEKLRRHGTKLLTAGFPSDQLPKVISKIENAGGKVKVVSDVLVEFSNIKFTAVTAEHPQEKEDSGIVDMIRQYDLSKSTPLSAINFIACLQDKLKC